MGGLGLRSFEFEFRVCVCVKRGGRGVLEVGVCVLNVGIFVLLFNVNVCIVR